MTHKNIMLCLINSVKKVTHTKTTGIIKRRDKLGTAAAFCTEPALKR